MKRCASSILVGLGISLLAQTTPSSSQQPLNSTQSVAPKTPQVSLLSTRSTLVLAPALVRNKAGDLVFTLAANDFVLTDDGVPQKLTLEQDTGGEPLALVVILEIGGAGAREFNQFSSIAPPLAPMLASIVGNVPTKSPSSPSTVSPHSFRTSPPTSTLPQTPSPASHPAAPANTTSKTAPPR
jgi:hypothetical protein